MEPITYASAGVNIERAESFVSRLKQKAERGDHSKMWPAAGGYAAVYPLGPDAAVAVTTDGVGTKLLVAHELKNHKTVGIDLVAMVANDLICVGATPTMFLDYFAVGALDDNIADDIIAGIIEGCDRASMILAGGETAEMPDLYSGQHYDLAGFAVGHLSRAQLLTGEKIEKGQLLVGVASSGIHSNGLSLARKVLANDPDGFKMLLEPTHIYVKPVLELLKKDGLVSGIAHITGGGWRNLFRLNPRVGFIVENPLPVPGVLAKIAAYVQLDEMYRTFNMGMGLALTVSGEPELVVETFNAHGFVAQVLGRVTDEPSKLILEPLQLTVSDHDV